MKSFLTFICLMVLPLMAQAEDPLRIEHTLSSKFPEQERRITVSLPGSYYSQSKHEYPVLYLLDGESNLNYSQAVAQFLAENGLVPEPIIVAMHAGMTRARDYLPQTAGGEASLSGDADQFLDYMARELMPFIEKQYRAAPLRLLSGHSYGGVFVIHAMIERPGLFQGYFAQSPFLDQKVGDPLVERLAKFLEANPKLNNFYYMNLGDEPTLEQNFNQMKAVLEVSAPKTFQWHVERSPGKTHMTTRMVGQYTAFEQMFATAWPLSQQEMFMGKYTGVKEHIDGLSKRYGYPVLYNEQLLAQATQIFLSQQDVESGAEMAQLYVSQYPRSPMAHFFLANALGSSGERDQAADAIKTAIELYEAAPMAALQPLYANMKQLQQQLTAD